MSTILSKCPWIITACLLLAASLHAQPAGTISGQVQDVRTKHPLTGATVYIQSISRGAATGMDGRYKITDLPIGAYTVRFSYVGYETVTVTDVIVRPERITYSDAELKPAVLGAAEAVVTAGPFSEEREATGIIARDAEEIRRAPGAAGDLSRALTSLPSVAKVNDLRNGLVVRGGSPLENGFYLDGIQIQNINHFPTQGSSGGAIGLINTDLIRDVQFQSGGFSSAYGNRLSSVTNLRLREGNREETEVQLDLNLAGFGFVAEGPIDDRGSSWILSARRSYLDFLVNHLMGDEVDAVPTYGDVQGKAVVSLSQKSRIAVVGVLGIDLSGIDRESADDEDENTYGDFDYATVTVGGSWRYLLGKYGFTATYLSFGWSRTSIDSYETATGRFFYGNQSRERVIRFRQVTSLARGLHAIEFGADAEIEIGDYRLTYAEETNPFGGSQPALHVDDELTIEAFGLFATYSWRLGPLLTVSPGARLDYGSSNKGLYLSPRFSAAVGIDAKTRITLSAGRYVQRPPGVLLSQSASDRSLPNMEALHLAANVSRLLSPDTRFTLEGFVKAYSDFPMDMSQARLFIVDELFYKNASFSSFGSHPHLIAGGSARSAGIEAMIQKKLVRRLYGLASASYARSRYRDLLGRWRNRVTDNRVMATLEGGYKPNERWEFSLRWIYAGGVPYTPFDAAASTAAGTGIYDETRINAARLPDYHSLSVRVDRRFYFKSSSLIAYLSLWNAYGHRNVAGYYWNEIDERVQAVEQFGTLPIVGLEMEF